MKKWFAMGTALLLAGCILFTLCSCSSGAGESKFTSMLDMDALDTPVSYYQALKGQKINLSVYNWGEYMSDGQDDTMDINKEFEALTGISVNYTNYPSNEDMYAKLKSGATNYDIIIPSDYMIARMISEKMIQKLDLTQIPNYKLIMDNMKNLDYDPTNEYSVPYTWGTVGLIYNKKHVDAADVTSWNVLWNKKYAKKILMFRNSRDAFAIAQRLLGYSLNSTNEKEYEDCAELLKKQREVVKIYVMDEVFDKMIGVEAYLAPYYAGDAMTMMEDNPDLAFSIPKEGTNRFVDAVCIPAESKNTKAAQMYINFLNETQVALANIEYICYSTPHKGAFEQLDDETKNNPVAYPSQQTLENTQTFVNLPKNINTKLDNLWEQILMTEDENRQRWVFPVIFGLLTLCCVAFFIGKSIRKHKNAEL